MPAAPASLRLAGALAGILLAAALTSNGCAGEANFDCADPGFVRAAEQARLDSAQFWSGTPLPGRWSAPCRISLGSRDAAACGRTTFVFDRGEVSGWNMFLSGPRAALLRDVLPHEVDHMVRASLVRRPIPRWLDEGCATLMESAESHHHCRELLPRHLPGRVDRTFLDAADYPTRAAEFERVYAVGFSLVEFLLERGGPQRLLAVQSDPRPLSQSIEVHYAIGVESLDERWREWVQRRQDGGTDCRSVGCHRHACDGGPPSGVAAEFPVLTIYTSAWCEPCRRFWSDYRSDPRFRSTILNRFRVRVVDVDWQPEPLRSGRIDGVPTFEAAATTATGYQGKDWLLSQLGLTATIPERPRQAPVQPDAPPPATNRDPGRESVSAVDVSAADVSVAGPPPNDIAVDAGGPSVTSGPAPAGPTPAAAFASRIVPIVLTSLQLAGVIGGSAATGGAGALAVAAWIYRRRRRRRQRAKSATKGAAADRPAPFPRALDEARELRRLRQTEGRVAVLDALRGMLLDDELARLEATAALPEREVLQRLRTALDARVDEIAPRSVKLET